MSATHRPASSVQRPRGAKEPLPARERLLATATELFTKRGYAATSVREIVEGAGVTKPILYHHFGSKEGIFDALIQRMEQEMDVVFVGVRETRGGALAQLRALGHALLSSVERFLPEVRLLHALYYGPREGTPEVSLLDFPKKFEEIIGDIVREGIRAGDIRRGDVKAMTVALQGIFSITIETHLSDHIDSVDREGIDRLLDVVFRGIAAPQRTKDTAR